MTFFGDRNCVRTLPDLYLHSEILVGAEAFSRSTSNFDTCDFSLEPALTLLRQSHYIISFPWQRGADIVYSIPSMKSIYMLQRFPQAWKPH